MQDGMTMYLGVKYVGAVLMTRGAYNSYRGWELPIDEDGADEGFLVEYVDGGTQNHPNHTGYISWSPKEVFQRAYKMIGLLNFSDALLLVRMGHKIARQGWNGKGMFLFLVPGSTFTVNRAPLLGIYPEGTKVDYCPHIDMRTADGKIVPWLASQTDLLAEDWLVVE